MPRLRFSAGARRDLNAIIDASVREWGIGHAQTYAAELVAALNRLKDHPESAPLVAGRTDGVRRLNAGSHMALYRLEGDSVRVLRILHQRMDPARHLV